VNDRHKENAQSPKACLLERELRPKKSFGQNFMLDQRINSIMSHAACSWGKGPPALEIGAGTGSLTNHLLASFALVHAVERDRDLIPILREQFKEPLSSGHLVLHEADGARFDIGSIVTDENPGVLIGNLPYHLTSSIIILALKNYRTLKGCVFLVQKEVADRLTADAGCKEYGFLTAVLGLAFTIEKIAPVHRSAFWPAPRVDSAIIKLDQRDFGISEITNIDEYLHFVRAIFQKRRKKLSTIMGKSMNKELFAKIGIDPDLRPEQLKPGQFLTLYKNHLPM
jgi:16S rRNA (adenine1518-N6/adenine1519-N6)-dimethyltransferase